MSDESDLLTAAPGGYRLFRPEARLSLDKRSTKGSASWVVPAAFIVPALKVVAGTVETLGTGLGASLSRIVPLRHPMLPYLIASDADAQACGHNGQTGTGDYKYWKINVNFSTPDYDLDGNDAFLTVSTRPSGRSVEAPDGVFSVGSPVKFVAGYTYTATLHRVGVFDNALYQGLAGSVNNAPFRGSPTGTALFHGPNAQRTTNFGGVTTFEVGLDFEISKIPWNSEIQADGSIAEVTYGSGTRWHPYVSFDQLFPALV